MILKYFKCLRPTPVKGLLKPTYLKKGEYYTYPHCIDSNFKFRNLLGMTVGEYKKIRWVGKDEYLEGIGFESIDQLNLLESLLINNDAGNRIIAEEMYKLIYKGKL